MIVTRIIGGLGNQMFQYAAGKAVARRLGVELKLDISQFDNYETHAYELHKFFDIPEEIISKKEFEKFSFRDGSVFSRLGQKMDALKGPDSRRIFLEDGLRFNADLLKIQDQTVISGYWQSEKYFKAVKTEIRNLFKIEIEGSGIDVSNCDAVSLHIRRGNYVDAKNLAYHGLCSLEYYQEAVAYLSERLENIKLFVFSDDIDWCRKALKFPCPVEFVEGHDASNSHYDMALMSACQHHIIANSTFSWWGAWLNNSSSKIVIAPKTWFKNDEQNAQTADLIPDSWIRS